MIHVVIEAEGRRPVSFGGSLKSICERAEYYIGNCYDADVPVNVIVRGGTATEITHIHDYLLGFMMDLLPPQTLRSALEGSG
jgi:hypothetical protein